MQEASSFDMSLHMCQTSRHHILQECNNHSHHSENLKSHSEKALNSTSQAREKNMCIRTYVPAVG